MGIMPVAAGVAHRTAPVVAAVLVALAGAAPAGADPLNPGHPDYCGKAPDFFVCAEHRSTYPNAGESGFLDATRGRVPGHDARHLAAGRGSCLDLAASPPRNAVADAATYLGISEQAAAEVVDDANRTICPWVQR